MEFGHSAYHLGRDLKLWKMNMRLSKGVRRNLEANEDGYLFRPAKASEFAALERLHLSIFRKPIVNWLRWVYKFRAPQLITVAIDKTGAIAAYSMFMFNESEENDRIIHELYVAVRPDLQGQGLSSKLRRFAVSAYDHGTLKGVSTLAAEHDIKALRSAQKSGYGIVKMAAKPPAYYLYQSLTPRYSS